MSTIRDLAAAFLFGLLLLWAATCHACFYGSSFVASYSYAPQVAFSYSFAPAVYAVPQVAYAAAPCVQTEAAVVAAPAVSYAQPAFATTYAAPAFAGYASSYGVGFNSFAVNSYGYGANVNVFAGRRAFFRSDVVDVRVGRRSFFSRAEVRAERPRSVVTRSVTRTRTRVR